MSGAGSHTGEGLGAAIKKGVGMFHGTGEAIRGNFNAAVDSATGDREAAARNQNIAARGVDEFENGHYHGTGAGVTPKDTDRERVNRAIQGESATAGSTNFGPHGTNVGNKIDPTVNTSGYDGSTEPIDPPQSSERPEVEIRLLQPRELRGSVHHINLISDTSESGAILQNLIESPNAQKTSQDESKPDVGGPRRSSDNVQATRAETFRVPKRSETEPQVKYDAKNQATASEVGQPTYEDEKKEVLKLNDPDSDRPPKGSSDREDCKR